MAKEPTASIKHGNGVSNMDLLQFVLAGIMVGLAVWAIWS